MWWWDCSHVCDVGRNSSGRVRIKVAGQVALVGEMNRTYGVAGRYGANGFVALPCRNEA